MLQYEQRQPGVKLLLCYFSCLHSQNLVWWTWAQSHILKCFNVDFCLPGVKDVDFYFEAFGPKRLKGVLRGFSTALP